MFLPTISTKKQEEMINLKQKLTEPKARQVTKPIKINVDTYKQDKYQPVNWNYQGIPPKEPKKFLKIDYLRFNNKKEFEEMVN